MNDHQMLAGSYMFCIFEDVLLGYSPAHQCAQYAAVGRTNHGPFHATQNPQEQRRQSPSYNQRAEPGNPQESRSREQAQQPSSPGASDEAFFGYILDGDVANHFLFSLQILGDDGDLRDGEVSLIELQ